MIVEVPFADWIRDQVMTVIGIGLSSYSCVILTGPVWVGPLQRWLHDRKRRRVLGPELADAEKRLAAAWFALKFDMMYLAPDRFRREAEKRIEDLMGAMREDLFGPPPPPPTKH